MVSFKLFFLALQGFFLVSVRAAFPVVLLGCSCFEVARASAPAARCPEGETVTEQLDENSCPAVEELPQSALQEVLRHHYDCRLCCESDLRNDDARFLAARLSHHACHYACRKHCVRSITANHFAFAALMQDGSVVTWGVPEKGGCSLGREQASLSASDRFQTSAMSDAQSMSQCHVGYT